MKTGVLGGTFDPIHLGHLAVADEACRLLALNKVIFMPAGHPYFKDSAAISPAADRVKMLELAVAGHPAYVISLLEVERPGPSYAVESIAQIKRQLKPEDEIFFIMGWDSIMTLHLWHEAERLINSCRIVAAPRPGFPPPDLTIVEKNLPGITEHVIVMQRPLIDISATLIREKASLSLPVDGLVPPAVAEYIRTKGLYKIKS